MPTAFREEYEESGNKALAVMNAICKAADVMTCDIDNR